MIKNSREKKSYQEVGSLCVLEKNRKLMLDVCKLLGNENETDTLKSNIFL